MKKSKAITLVLVTGLLGCKQNKQQSHIYMRTDTTGNYSPTTSGFHGYYVFRAYGSYYDGAHYGKRHGRSFNNFGGHAGYVRQGYSSSAVHTSHNGSVSRGGFGSIGGFHASSSS
ncbi:hypothetical protein BDD43_5517 [Mucilaginibacter gracilis]|uniref:Lipoprotein n=1 Tax=Mucilaginibacter gracilis TaxID=423350 RepID=A0A495J8Z2_9SPHI|nr:hypothetical protein [Mucilaginibacter gracilis]RKR85253.1 hypothetical protein BDD43_5517 [Mucilaginibacter gracilis]